MSRLKKLLHSLVDLIPEGDKLTLNSYHWLYLPGEDIPPIPFKMAYTHPWRKHVIAGIKKSAKYALRAATDNGRINDFDPDAVVQLMVKGMIGPDADSIREVPNK